MKQVPESQLRAAYKKYRSSIGKPPVGPEVIEKSVTYSHFCAGFLAGRDYETHTTPSNDEDDSDLL